MQEQIDRLKYFEKEADLKHRNLDATLKELDSRISKIEKDKMANESNNLMKSEGDMKFETSTKDVVYKTAIGNDQNSSKQLNFLERIIFGPRVKASANHQK